MTSQTAVTKDPYEYHDGFGNHISSEAVKGSLPLRGNSPQKVAHGLYAEQLSGTAFTAPRHDNQRSWLYRIRPSVGHSRFVPYASHFIGSFHAFSPGIEVNPMQMRWNPFDIPSPPTDFIDGLRTIAGAGDSQMKNGLAIHVYGCNTSMQQNRKAFYTSDGDFLIVPQEGALDIKTEFGHLYVQPNEICVIQRGIKYSVDVAGQSRGFVLEIFTGHFELPDLGPIGANCLANPRDFQHPTASFEDKQEEWTIINKFMGSAYSAIQDRSPFDVVAFHGNYVPYKYDLAKFCVIGSISFDHPDPSIFTVLTAKSPVAGTAVADFVIFPPRWLVQEDTFRPPYFHRNCMSEFMVNLAGEYDAKAEGFSPGGASLHNMNTAHGPDLTTFENASNAKLEPKKIGVGSMSIMFESMFQLATTKWAVADSGKLQPDYPGVWSGMKRNFKA